MKFNFLVAILASSFCFNAYAYKCTVTKRVDDKEEIRAFESKSFVYDYSANKQLVITIADKAKEPSYSIEYKSYTKPGEKDYISFKITCDKNVSCKGLKENNFSYHKDKKEMPLEPNGYGASLNHGGRDMLHLSLDGKKTIFKFIDLKLDGNEDGAEVVCE